MTANTIACPNATGVNRWTFTLDSTTWIETGKLPLYGINPQ